MLERFRSWYEEENIAAEIFLAVQAKSITQPTLLPWDETVIGNESMQWVKAMQEAGIKICVITNSGSKRTDEVMKNTGLLYVPSAFSYNFV